MATATRRATLEDIPSITSWTSDTFEWGDYVPERLGDWIEAAESEVMVAVDETDTPIALAHVVMLSATEGWLEGARVHPEHRRRGLGSLLNGQGVAWARKHGARVVRLAIEEHNHPAREQVATLGYREVTRWVSASFDVDRTHRCADHLRLRPAPGADAEAAWLTWAAGDIARAGREMLNIGWRWRRATIEDLADREETTRLYRSPTGWVVIERSGGSQLRSRWVSTEPDHVLSLIDGIKDLAAGEGVGGGQPQIPGVALDGRGVGQGRRRAFRTGRLQPRDLTLR